MRNLIKLYFKKLRDKKAEKIIAEEMKKNPELEETMHKLKKLSDEGWDKVRAAYKKKGYDV